MCTILFPEIGSIIFRRETFCRGTVCRETFRRRDSFPWDSLPWDSLPWNRLPYGTPKSIQGLDIFFSRNRLASTAYIRIYFPAANCAHGELSYAKESHGKTSHGERSGHAWGKPDGFPNKEEGMCYTKQSIQTRRHFAVGSEDILNITGYGFLASIYLTTRDSNPDFSIRASDGFPNKEERMCDTKKSIEKTRRHFAVGWV